MKIRITKKKVLNLKTLIKNLALVAIGLLMPYVFYCGWIYEQTVTNGYPWLGGA